MLIIWIANNRMKLCWKVRTILCLVIFSPHLVVHLHPGKISVCVVDDGLLYLRLFPTTGGRRRSILEWGEVVVQWRRRRCEFAAVSRWGWGAVAHLRQLIGGVGQKRKEVFKWFFSLWWKYLSWLWEECPGWSEVHQRKNLRDNSSAKACKRSNWQEMTIVWICGVLVTVNCAVGCWAVLGAGFVLFIAGHCDSHCHDVGFRIQGNNTRYNSK